MSSWQAYVDTLKKAGDIQDVAIWGIEDFSAWASTPGFNVTSDEIKFLASGSSSFGEKGLYIAGQKCRMLRNAWDNEDDLTLKLKTAKDANDQTTDILIGKSNKAFIIVTGKPGSAPGGYSTALYNITSYLKRTSY